jgi:predicted ATP-grasp superfamily ATP-dependent carboligase
MKRDDRTGKHYIIEPNIGRPTGRSAIAEFAGVELVYTMYCDLTGTALPENRVQKYQGTKWIYLRRDLQSAFYYWRKGKLSLRAWLKSIWGVKKDAVFSWTDLKPFLADFSGSTLTAFSGRKRKNPSNKAERETTAAV